MSVAVASHDVGGERVAVPDSVGLVLGWVTMVRVWVSVGDAVPGDVPVGGVVGDGVGLAAPGALWVGVRGAVDSGVLGCVSSEVRVWS